MQYPLYVQPPVGGTFFGSVTFTDPAGDYFWQAPSLCSPLISSFHLSFTLPPRYTLEVHAENPKFEREIEVWVTSTGSSSDPPLQVSTKVRSAVAVEIGVSNPMDQDITFQVVLEGDGLIGYESLTVQSLSLDLSRCDSVAADKRWRFREL